MQLSFTEVAQEKLECSRNICVNNYQSTTRLNSTQRPELEHVERTRPGRGWVGSSRKLSTFDNIKWHRSCGILKILASETCREFVFCCLLLAKRWWWYLNLIAIHKRQLFVLFHLQFSTFYVVISLCPSNWVESNSQERYCWRWSSRFTFIQCTKMWIVWWYYSIYAWSTSSKHQTIEQRRREEIYILNNKTKSRESILSSEKISQLHVKSIHIFSSSVFRYLVRYALSLFCVYE